MDHSCVPHSCVPHSPVIWKTSCRRSKDQRVLWDAVFVLCGKNHSIQHVGAKQKGSEIVNKRIRWNNIFFVVAKDWVELDVSENSGTPKSSISIGFSIINHPFWGTPIFGNIQIIPCEMHNFTWFWRVDLGRCFSPRWNHHGQICLFLMCHSVYFQHPNIISQTTCKMTLTKNSEHEDQNLYKKIYPDMYIYMVPYICMTVLYAFYLLLWIVFAEVSRWQQNGGLVGSQWILQSRSDGSSNQRSKKPKAVGNSWTVKKWLESFHPWKITVTAGTRKWIKMGVWFRWFSFSNRWFEVLPR